MWKWKKKITKWETKTALCLYICVVCVYGCVRKLCECERTCVCMWMWMYVNVCRTSNTKGRNDGRDETTATAAAAAVAASVAVAAFCWRTCSAIRVTITEKSRQMLRLNKMQTGYFNCQTQLRNAIFRWTSPSLSLLLRCSSTMFGICLLLSQSPRESER